MCILKPGLPGNALCSVPCSSFPVNLPVRAPSILRSRAIAWALPAEYALAASGITREATGESVILCYPESFF
jgi:hypothetical protein